MENYLISAKGKKIVNVGIKIQPNNLIKFCNPSSGKTFWIVDSEVAKVSFVTTSAPAPTWLKIPSYPIVSVLIIDIGVRTRRNTKIIKTAKIKSLFSFLYLKNNIPNIEIVKIKPSYLIRQKIPARINDDKINLAFVLNLIDGIRETPGRIIIITSNYYNKLDAALIRPGRIDITLNMKNASCETCII